jgi:CBS domain-containing protein
MERTLTTATRRLNANHIMQRHVVTVSPLDTLRQALALMTENHVTGLPVMDDNSRCIGVISASDILNYEQEHADDGADGDVVRFFDPETEQWESYPVSAYGLEEIGEIRVEEIMTRDLVWVHRSTDLKEVARRMIEANVHRVLVLDDHALLYGIISAYDLVRVIAED